MPRGQLHDGWALVRALGAVAVVTLAYTQWIPVSNAAVVSTTLLLVVVIVAATARFRVAAVTSVVAMLCFNYFFLPPVGTFTIVDPHNWVALFAFLAVSLVASNLSATARARTLEAVGRRDELARLFDLSRDVLVMTAGPDPLGTLCRAVVRRFDLEVVAIAVPRDGRWDIAQAGARTIQLPEGELDAALTAARATLEFDARARAYAGHRGVVTSDETLRLVPLRAGTAPIGLLAAGGRPVEAGTLDALAGIVAIAVERARFLEERKAAELTRQREELKTTLLASLGHDLRTPLTSIRIAAGNLASTWLSDAERTAQGELILAEVARLSRLFENVIEMARIDAGAVTAEIRRVHPSEIVAAARERIGTTLDRHAVAVHVDPDEPVPLDPRLTAAALAQVLENAAQYAPAGSTIDIRAQLVGEGLLLAVADRGPGIAASDLPHVFDRFYRGRSAESRAGTGMGLWIAKGLLAAEHGRIWVENRPDGGAEFSLLIPTTSSAALAPPA
jgi:two-component system sensor histidine kinase KdpD